MDTSVLKENFTNQLKEIDEKISQIQGELSKAQEYKLKLQGGLETLELLEQSSKPNEIDMPESPESNVTNPYGHLDSAFGLEVSEDTTEE